jgi:hypothetical protein
MTKEDIVSQNYYLRRLNASSVAHIREHESNNEDLELVAFSPCEYMPTVSSK